MITVFRLSARIVGRSIDRSTGSPLSRYLLIAALLALPVVMITMTGDREIVGQASAASDSVNLYIVNAAVALLVTVPTTIAWRIDRRLLEVFEVSPMAEGRWQLALLGPNLVIAIWMALSVSAALSVDIVRSNGPATATKLLVVVAAAGVAVAAALCGTVLGLWARVAVGLLPRRLQSVGRSTVLLVVSGFVLWASLEIWRWSNQLLVDAELAAAGTGLAFDVLPLTVVLLGGSAILIVILVRVGLRTPTPSDEQAIVPFRKLRLTGRASPGLLGLSWTRNPSSATQLIVAAALATVGLANGDWRWLAHAGLLLAATSFVGYAPGNVGMRPVVGVGARSPLAWFALNGLGAVVTWLAIVAGWRLAMVIAGDSGYETSMAASLVMAVSLVAGGLFAHSYRTSYGAELANLVAYCAAGASILVLIDQQVFARPPLEVGVGMAVALAIAVILYVAQSTSGLHWRYRR